MMIPATRLLLHGINEVVKVLFEEEFVAESRRGRRRWLISILEREKLHVLELCVNMK